MTTIDGTGDLTGPSPWIRVVGSSRLTSVTISVAYEICNPRSPSKMAPHFRWIIPFVQDGRLRPERTMTVPLQLLSAFVMQTAAQFVQFSAFHPCVFSQLEP